MSSWIMVANPNATAATVHIYIGGTEMTGSPFTIAAGGKITPRFGVTNGPVKVTSNIPVINSERVHTAQGFVNEIMGVPTARLATDYLFPWYDNITMQAWVLMARP